MKRPSEVDVHGLRAGGKQIGGNLMEPAGHRHVRIQELMRRELDGVLRDEVNDPCLQAVRIGQVVMSVDYRHARVHYTVSPAQGGADRRSLEAAFVRAGPFLRRRLAEAIDFKRVPDLRFVLDAETVE